VRLIGGHLAGVLVVVTCSVQPALAQPFEQAGLRAQGMGGAFVGVADDASAVWWNPAGLAAGPFFTVLVEHQQQPDPGEHVTALALAVPPLGVSYQRVREPVSAAAPAGNDRETESEVPQLRLLVAHVTGVTLLHSVTSGFVVGTTLKFVHGDVDERSTNRLDLDVGAHYRAGRLSAGLVVRNVTEPSFSAQREPEVTLERQVRAGIGVAAGRTTIAADVDLTDVVGAWPGRRVAVGAERRFGERFAARGGVRCRLRDGPDPWVSLGGSYAIRTGIWLDGFWGRSPDQDARWGIGARVAY
jgi:hypothetical protein